MKFSIDRPQAFLIVSIVVALVALAFFLSTFFPQHNNLVTRHQNESVSALNGTTNPASEATGFPSTSNPMPPISEKDDSDDITKQHVSNADPIPSSENLTETDILASIEELEKKKTELHQVFEHKHQQWMLLQDRIIALDDEFQVKFNENLRERQVLVEDFEQNELNGDSIDETSRTATPEELEELARRPGARALLDAISQEKAMIKQWRQSDVLVDKANALSTEWSEIFRQMLATDKSIAELKSMLP